MISKDDRAGVSSITIIMCASIRQLTNASPSAKLPSIRAKKSMTILDIPSLTIIGCSSRNRHNCAVELTLGGISSLSYWIEDWV